MITDLSTHPSAYVHPAELADYLGMSRRTVYYWIAKGAIVAVKVSGTLLIPIAEARACLTARVPVCNPSNSPHSHA